MKKNLKVMTRRFSYFRISIAIILSLLHVQAMADSNLKVPRFVTIKSGKVNVRVGPGTHFPLKWIYTKTALPVEIIAEFDTWRKIRDVDGSDGWVHQNMLVGKRNVLIKKTCIMNDSPSSQGKPVAQVNENATLQLIASDDGWCLLKSNRIKGWAKKENCWGVYKDEIIKG
jgi:SH3-like domain-containing protein